MTCRERRRDAVRLTKPPRHADRLGRELAGALRWLREDEVLGEPRKDAYPQDAVSRLQHREGLLEESEVRIIGVPGGVEPSPRAEHGPCQPIGGRKAAGKVERLHERR